MMNVLITFAAPLFATSTQQMTDNGGDGELRGSEN